MKDVNSITIEGNVTRVGDTTLINDGKTTVYVFPIGVNYYYESKDGIPFQESSFFNVKTFNKLAIKCAKECTKGRWIRVNGSLTQNRWKDKDGNPQSRIFIIANSIEFAR